MNKTKYLSKSVEGWEVFQWPEFKDLAKRLGIPLDLRTVKLTLTIECDKIVTCEQIYHGEDVRRES